MTHTLKIKNVKPGHSIPALDNGHVVDVEREDDGYVTITFHDPEGEEAYLRAHKSMRVEVDAEEPQPVW